MTGFTHFYFGRKPGDVLRICGALLTKLHNKPGEKRLWREAKPGGFQTGGFPLFFGKGPDCVAVPFRDCSSWVLLIGRERGKGPIGKIPKKSGKSQKGQKRTKKEGQVQIGKPSRLNPPRLAALEIKFSGENSEFEWRRRPEIADFCPLSWSNMS